MRGRSKPLRFSCREERQPLQQQYLRLHQEKREEATLAGLLLLPLLLLPLLLLPLLLLPLLR
jgi:hypothetical protein